MGLWRVYIEGRERGKLKERDPWFNNGVWRAEGRPFISDAN